MPEFPLSRVCGGVLGAGCFPKIGLELDDRGRDAGGKPIQPDGVCEPRCRSCRKAALVPAFRIIPLLPQAPAGSKPVNKQRLEQGC